MEINETFDSIKKQISFFESKLNENYRIQISFPCMSNSVPLLLTHFWYEAPDLLCFYSEVFSSLVVLTSNNVQFVLEKKWSDSEHQRVVFAKPQ